MPIVLDGNNLLHDLPVGERTRETVRRIALERVRHERQRVTVVFDGPPPTGSPDREVLGRVTVVWGGARSADDVIVATLPNGPAASQWVVVSDDRGLARRARERGAQVRPLAAWRARSGRPDRADRPRGGAERVGEISSWESYFADGRDHDDGPQRVPRRRRRAAVDPDDL